MDSTVFSMEPQSGQDDGKSHEDSLGGTTLRVYRSMLRSRTPLGIRDIQRALGLSSPSVVQYHLRKLIEMGLVREDEGGYVVDKVILENVIRIRKTAIPLQVAYVAFFVSSLIVMLTLFRPTTFTSIYIFATVVIIVGVMIAARETLVTLRHI